MYRRAVWDSIELFEAFSIEVVPKEQNERVDSLVVATSTLQPCDELVPW